MVILCSVSKEIRRKEYPESEIKPTKNISRLIPRENSQNER